MKINPDAQASIMTVRAAIAGEILAGMLAHPTRYKPHNPGTPWMLCISNEAVNLADALICALNNELVSEVKIKTCNACNGIGLVKSMNFGSRKCEKCSGTGKYAVNT